MSRNIFLSKAGIIFCAGFFLANNAIDAQPFNETPAYMHVEAAEEQIALGSYYSALEQYELAYKQERDLAVAYKIGMLQFKLKDYKRAERWLSRIIAKDETGLYPDAVLAYARTLKWSGKFDDALEAFNVYATMVEGNDALLDQADLEVAGLQMAMKAEAPLELVIENMGKDINNAYTESSPVMHNDGQLYFSAIDTRKVIVLDGSAEEKYSKIYTSKYDVEDEEWGKPKALKKRINREGYHTANPSFSKDGSRMYFTRSIFEADHMTESKIFESAGGSGSWGAAQELAGVNGDYIARHPAVGALLGNEVLFFSSNMAGGEGGFDLYYAMRRGEAEYSLPVNLGPVVNTARDEITPHFRDNVLYFSSDGRPSIGGLDIFTIEWNGTRWSEPENLGAGYNTGLDDLYFTANTDGTRGFLVSNRPSEGARSVKGKTCCDDVFTFEIREIVIDLLTRVFDEEQQPLSGARVSIFEVVNNTPGQSNTKSNDNANDFNFLLDFDKSYKVTVQRDGYFPEEFEFNTVGIVDVHTVEKDVILKRAPNAEPETETISINEPIRLNNIYYDFDDDKILLDAEQDLEVLMGLLDEYDNMVIELSSHTDAQGPDKYNERLSQRRAQSAVDWLISRGIDPDRMQAVGYGEGIILNQCVNGVRCTDDEHRFNRRTEFKIIAGPTEIQVRKEFLGGEKKN